MACLVKCFLLCIFLTGCVLLSKPEYIGEISPNPASYWNNSEPYINPSYEVEDDIVYFQTQEKHSLAELVDLGLSNNPSTRLAWAQAKSFAYNYKSSQSILLPQVDFFETANFIDERIHLKNNVNGTGGSAIINPGNGGIGTGGNPIGTGSGISSAATSSKNPAYIQTTASELVIQYLLLDFGGRTASIESAWQALVSSNMLHNQVIQDVMISVITDYYTYLQNAALLQARKDDLKDAQTIFEMSSAQFESGIVNKVDVLQSESNLASATLNLQQQANLLANSLAALATAAGLPPETIFEVEEAPFIIPKEEIKTNVEYLMEIAKQERADLAAKQAVFLQRRYDLQVVKSNALPNITTTTNFLQTQYTHSSLKSSRTWVSTISLNVPIFYGFFYVNQFKRVEADVLAAYEDWRNLEQQVLLSVITSYYNLQTAIDNLNVADEFLKYSQEAFDALLVQYRDGVSTITDLLTAEARLADARAQQVQSRTQLMTSFAELTYSMGILNSGNEYKDLFPIQTQSENLKESQKKEEQQDYADK